MDSEHTVVEKDVPVETVDVLSQEIESKKNSEKPKKTRDVTAIAGGKTKHVGKHEFIRAAQTYKPKIDVVDLPEPFEGRQMKVKELTAGERDTYEGKMIRGRLGNQKIDLTELRVGLVIMACVDWDDETTRLFDDRDKDDLKKMGISVIQAIYEKASKLSAVSKEDEDELMGE